MDDLFPIDLRSDTVTKPTPAMRKVMADAVVGDDVFGEDPTANRLHERVAEILGKPAALFVPSGTMGNQICIAALTRPGDEVLLDPPRCRSPLATSSSPTTPIPAERIMTS